MRLSPAELEAANELADHITRAMVVAGRKVGQAAFEMVAATMPPLSSPGPGGAHLPGKPHSLNDHAKTALVVSSPEAMNKGTKSAKTGGEETLSPRTMHKGSPGGLSAGDTFPCYNCDQPIARIHAKPDEGYCARCDKVVSERPPLMPGRPDTFLCPKGHTAKRIMWSANGWCSECNEIVEEVIES